MVGNNKVIENKFFSFDNAKSYKESTYQAHLQAFSYRVLTWIVLSHNPVEILKRFNEHRKLAKVEIWNLNRGAKFIFPDIVNEGSTNNSKIL